MEFNAPAGENLFDRSKIVGKSTPRIDGPLKVSGRAPYAAERHDVAANQAYGWIVGAGIAKGRIRSMDLDDARRAPGVIAIVALAFGDLRLGEGEIAGLTLLFGRL